MNVLVLDCGSSALKATVFGPEGAVIASVDAGYPKEAEPHRFDPEDWWRAAVEAAGKLPLAGVGAISLTGTMEKLIMLDMKGSPFWDAVMCTYGGGTERHSKLSARV